ncbi:MAG TPA: hypothetical protein VGF20_06070, partial [Candidatus Acidoferrum sp.]
MPENQGLSAVAFFEVTAFVILLVLFVLLRKDHPTRFLTIWMTGWTVLTLKAFLELTQLSIVASNTRPERVVLLVLANFIFLEAVVRYSRGNRPLMVFYWPGALAVILTVCLFESRSPANIRHVTWETSFVLAASSLAAGRYLWNFTRDAKGHGARLLAGLFLLTGLHGLDRPLW